MHSGGQFYQQPQQQQQQQREPPPLETPSQTIYVNHINQKIKPNVLKEHLQTIFSKYGTILELHVRKSYKTRGQAWVTYENMDDAKKAIDNLIIIQTEFNDLNINNTRPIQVNYSKNKAITIAKKDGTYKERKRVFDNNNNNNNNQNGNDGNNDNNNKRMKIDNPPHSTLLIQHIPKEMEEQQLIEIFNKFPKFKKFRFIRIRDVAFVDFDNVSSATHAINEIRRVEPSMYLNYAKQ